MSKNVNYDKIALICEPQQEARRDRSKLLIQLLLSLVGTISLFVLLFTICNAQGSLPLKSPVNNECEKVNFKFLQLTITWPATYCMFGRCAHPIPNKWGIHGLWPSLTKDKWPESCCPDWVFNKNVIKPILSQLEDKWFNLNPDSEENDFWRHEWMKHGTCSRASPLLDGELAYFNTTLNLFDKYNIFDWLISENFVPDMNKSYSLKSLQELIAKKYESKVTIVCRKEEVNGHPHFLLSGIQFCLDTSLNPVDCPITNNYCKDQITYPVINGTFT